MRHRHSLKDTPSMTQNRESLVAIFAHTSRHSRHCGREGKQLEVRSFHPTNKTAILRTERLALAQAGSTGTDVLGPGITGRYKPFSRHYCKTHVSMTTRVAHALKNT